MKLCVNIREMRVRIYSVWKYNILINSIKKLKMQKKKNRKFHLWLIVKDKKITTFENLGVCRKRDLWHWGQVKSRGVLEILFQLQQI